MKRIIYRHFWHTLLTISEHYNYRYTPETMMTERLVRGVRIVGVQKWLLAESSLTLVKALRKLYALAVEAATKDASDL